MRGRSNELQCEPATRDVAVPGCRNAQEFVRRLSSITGTVQESTTHLTSPRLQNARDNIPSYEPLLPSCAPSRDSVSSWLVRILIIEDEPKAIAYLRKGLRENGFVVDAAQRGDDGLHQALSVDYDLIVLDVMVPGMDGWSVISNLRRRCRTGTHRRRLLAIGRRESIRADGGMGLHREGAEQPTHGPSCNGCDARESADRYLSP